MALIFIILSCLRCLIKRSTLKIICSFIRARNHTNAHFVTWSVYFFIFLCKLIDPIWLTWFLVLQHFRLKSTLSSHIQSMHSGKERKVRPPKPPRLPRQKAIKECNICNNVFFYFILNFLIFLLLNTFVIRFLKMDQIWGFTWWCTLEKNRSNALIVSKYRRVAH